MLLSHEINTTETNNDIELLKEIRSLHKKSPEKFEEVDQKNKKRIIGWIKMWTIIYYIKGDYHWYIKINKPSWGWINFQKKIKDKESAPKVNRVYIKTDSENWIILITEEISREKTIIDIEKDTLKVYDPTIGSGISFSWFRDSIRDSIRGSLNSIFHSTRLK